MEPASWWARMRRAFNAGLTLGGVTAFGLYVMTVGESSHVEITVFTVALQALAFGTYAVCANGAYSLVPALERRLAPADLRAFRRKLFAAGLVVAIAPPLSIPLLAYLARAHV